MVFWQPRNTVADISTVDEPSMHPAESGTHAFVASRINLFDSAGVV